MRWTSPKWGAGKFTARNPARYAFDSRRWKELLLLDRCINAVGGINIAFQFSLIATIVQQAKATSEQRVPSVSTARCSESTDFWIC
jgi:hypothetical protein